MSEEIWWYLIRASGLAAWAVLASDVLVGLAMSTGFVPIRKAKDLHSWIGGLAVAVLGFHLITIVADTYMTFGPSDVLVQFASSWRPGAVAWGIAAFYLVAAVELSSVLRDHLPRRLWRGIHLASFVAFWFATMHAITAGSDLGVPFVAGVVVLTVAAVLGLLLLRIGQAAVPGARTALARWRQRTMASSSSGEATKVPSARKTMADAWTMPSSPPEPSTSNHFVVASAHQHRPATTLTATASVAAGEPVEGSRTW